MREQTGLGAGELKALKEEIRNGRTSALTEILEFITTPKALRQIREQKLLFSIRDPATQKTLADKYATAAYRVHSESAQAESNYARLAVVVTDLRAKFALRVLPPATFLKRFSKGFILQIANDATEELIRQVFTAYNEAAEAQIPQLRTDVGKASAVSERLIHTRNGEANDRTFAVARAFNFLSGGCDKENQSSPTRKEKEAVRVAFSQIVSIASRWNALDYITDKVSYGEWVVCEIGDRPIVKITCGIVDLAMERAKLIGIRRHLMRHFRPHREKRPIEFVFRSFAEQAFSSAKAYYLGENLMDGEIEPGTDELLNVLLSVLRSEDEMILGASEMRDEVLAEYLAALSLRVCLLAAQQAISLSDKRRRQKLRHLSIPVRLICPWLIAAAIPEQIATAAIERQITSVPANNHSELITHPFIKLRSSEVGVLRHLALGDWPAPIRSFVISGGTPGRKFGDVWEKECERTFAEYGWHILGRGLKIKECRRVITDIDALVLKDDLLLIVQFKATGIDASTVYEHWKARQIVAKGALQAKTAMEAMRSKPEWLANLTRGLRVSSKVEHFQPLVVTTSALFTGWKCEDVPIVSFGYLLSLLRGANVEYTDGSGDVIGKRSFAASAALKPNEFLALLSNPLDWQIAEEVTVCQRTVEDDEFSVVVPELELTR